MSKTTTIVSAVASAPTSTPKVDPYQAALAIIRDMASKTPHVATSDANRDPAKRASKIASALNSKLHRDPTTFAVRNEWQGARVLATMAREGITFAS